MEETTLDPVNPLRYTVEPRRRTPIDSAKAAQSKTDQFVDGLLISWFEWRRGYRLSKGYRSSDSTCQDYRAPGHYDWKNGASQERVENEIMRGVDRAISRVPNEPDRWATALEFEAMNLATGASVWSSKGLPADPRELEVLRLEARNKLMRELQREGVMSA
jgi:hypothetical protein